MEHEQVVIKRGPRTGLPVIVAVHSTALGQAIGGCRIKEYPDWRDGLGDALRLSEAMTSKCALAGLRHGGGKTVVALSGGTRWDRHDLLLDVGDVIAGLDGVYATGPDVGTGPDDMVTIAERTPYVFCRPPEAGGSGDSSEPTARGVISALQSLCGEVLGGDLSTSSFALLGLGRVGSHVWRMLTDAGATVITSDVDDSKRRGTWVTPEECLTADVDVLIPAALGGLLTPRSVAALRCRAVAGPANNQLDAPATADLLHARGIIWAPDAIVSAGGIIYATAVELRHETPARALERVRGIGATLTTVLRSAEAAGTTPQEAARRHVEEVLQNSRHSSNHSSA
ncbi:Glu/Leu/Phe/Val dehydrogenase dimerization domain-containing protein [Actinoplanes sp. NPDC051411]|uniref:Glu/Leu/Phe/Val dehydrogenase dimerization domain-containing protein n=1 Tax=Actinoplanes sp. NPDC051411 TaxID=3155522 RepID=UPI00342187EA